ncbi:MAG: hypothetical protein ABW148_00220 [Sedimenticola sp.]
MISSKQALLLLMMAAPCWAAPQEVSTATRLAPTQPYYPVDTIFIYSDGQVEKLLEKGGSWYVVEDMRKRRYKRDINFAIPTLEYQSLTSNYRQLISSGDPDSLFHPSNPKSSSFTVIRSRSDGSELKRNWSCLPPENSKIMVMGKPAKALKTTCSRHSWSRLSYNLKEQVELYYDTENAWVVKTVSHKRGKQRTRRLMAVLPPDEAKPLTIMRIVRKIRNRRTKRL